jgi:hypothetical protein
MMANLANLIHFLGELFLGMEQKTAKTAALVTGCAMFLFYLLGFLTALIGPRDYVQSQRSTTPGTAAPGASIGFFAAAWIGSIVTVGLACTWTGKAALPATFGAAAAGVTAPPTVVVGVPLGNNKDSNPV